MHWLTVPADPAAALSVEHSPTCRSRSTRIAGSSQTLTTYLCMVGRLVTQFGVEVWFCRVGNEDDGYASPGRISLRPGVYAIGHRHLQTVHGPDGTPSATVNVLELLTT